MERRRGLDRFFGGAMRVVAWGGLALAVPALYAPLDADIGARTVLVALILALDLLLTGLLALVWAFARALLALRRR